MGKHRISMHYGLLYFASRAVAWCLVFNVLFASLRWTNGSS